MTTPIEEELFQIKAMLRVLVDAQDPQITFKEIQKLLGYESKTSVRKWIADHRLKRLGKGRYRRADVIAKATRHAA